MNQHVVSLVCLAPIILGVACSNSNGTGPSNTPVVAVVNGEDTPLGAVGSTVLIVGQTFGSAPGSVLFSNGSGGTVAATIATAQDWTSSAIVTTVPVGAASGPLVVQTSGGTTSAVTFTVTVGETFDPSAVAWTAGSALPVPVSGHSVAVGLLRGPVSNTRVAYTFGGIDSTGLPRNTVSYALVGNTGGIGAWTATMALPESVAFARAFLATPRNSRVTAVGYLYVLGGITPAGPTNAIYRGTLALDGTVTGWTVVGTLPAPLNSFVEADVFGQLYIHGGSTTGSVPVATVYRTTVDSTGAIGTWQSLTALPFKRSYMAGGADRGYLYAFGGDSGTVTATDSTVSSTAIADVLYAQLDPITGAVSAAGWVPNPNSLIDAVSKGRSVVADGNVLLTAGLYTGAATGANEESYAALNVDGSVGAFTTATGTNTIAAGGGGNIFNQTETGYADGTGKFHVVVAGGDDVNTAGTKHKTLFIY